jgi:hypothetical protein
LLAMSSRLRWVWFVLLGIVLAIAAAEVALRPSLPEVTSAPAPDEAALAQEHERKYRESAFWARIRMRRQADLLRDDLADHEARVKPPRD